MLRLRSQAIHRLGIPGKYTCSSCRSTSRTAQGASGLRSGIAVQQLVHDDKIRLFTSTAFRSAGKAKNRENAKNNGDDLPKSNSTDNLSQQPDGDVVDTVPEPAAQDAPKTGLPKPKKKKPKKPKKAATTSVDDNQHQLKVLQGALAALKNVLDQQNIKVDDIKKAETRGARRKKPGSPIPNDSNAQKSPKSSKTKAQTVTAKSKDGTKPKLPAKIAPRLHGKVHSKPSKPTAGKPEVLIRKIEGAATKTKPVLQNPSRSHDKLATKPPRDINSTEPLVPPTPTTRDIRDVNSREPLGPPGVVVDPTPGIERINAKDLNLVPIHKEQPPVPAVSYGLERVLFNPGVYHLQDPHSKVFNFDPYLANIMPVKEFDFDALKQYVTSSKDVALIDVARENGKKYTGSTSSMTSMLSHFHYLLSAWRPINSSMMSQDFKLPSEKFTNLLRAPAATFLHWKDGVYAIDADKEFDSASILSMLGKSMEKLLTVPTEEFEKYRRGNSHQISEEERNAAEAYHYTGLGDFMMRSQLDAHDPRVPGTGMFDIKTRAVISIRMDAKGYAKGLGYELRHRHGNWESYEREYHDMIRAAFLKYSLQVRMGRMDGIFVAFHNTERIFGFQYIPLQEMDLSLHGTTDLSIGDKEFKLSLALLNKLLDRASEKFPEKSLRLFVETRTSSNTPFLYAFVKPVEPGEIEAVQNSKKQSIEMFERQMLGLEDTTELATTTSGDEEAEDKSIDVDQESNYAEAEEIGLEEDKDTAVSWDEIQVMVEDAMEDEELGVEAVRQAIEDALEESGLLEDQSPEESRGYVDALLSAVTGSSALSSSEAANITSADDVDAASSEVDVNQSTVNKTAAIDASSETSSGLSDDAGADDSISVHETKEPQGPDTLDTSSEADKESTTSTELENQTEEEPEVEETDSQDEATSPDMSTLSNLILRMTRRLDENGPVEKQRDDDVSSKLQEFERVLGKLISESREDEPESAAPSIVESTGTVAQTEDGPNAAEESARELDSTKFQDAVDTAAPEFSPGGVLKAESTEESPILGMVLTIRNKVNEKYVPRPERLSQDDTWEIEYNIEEMEASRAHRLFEMCRKRRQTAFSPNRKNAQSFNEMFGGALKKFCRQGRKFRREEDAAAKERPVFILGEQKPKSYAEVFTRAETETPAKEA